MAANTHCQETGHCAILSTEPLLSFSFQTWRDGDTDQVTVSDADGMASHRITVIRCSWSSTEDAM